MRFAEGAPLLSSQPSIAALGDRFVADDADQEALRRWQEAIQLSGQGDQRAVRTLYAYLADEHPFVRWQAGVGLAQIAERLRRRAHLGAPLWNRQAPELTFSGLLLLMRQSLRDPNPIRRAATADSLALWEHEAGVEFLLEALQDTDPSVRASVAAALGQIGDRAAVEPLLKALRDPSLWVRKAAADALGAIADPAAVPALEQLLGDEHPLARAAAVAALGHMSCAKAPELLERCLHDPDPGIRWYAARGLGQVGGVGAIPALEQLLTDQATLFGRSIGQVAQTAIEAITHREMGLFSRLRRQWQRIRKNLQHRP